MGGTYYLAGDGAVRSADRGYFRITGRIDDVLNVSGHRMGTMEIESALVAKTDLVAEAAVVGRPDDLTGEAICAFVVLKRGVPTGDEAKQIAKELRDWVAKEIGPIAKPKTSALVKTCPRPVQARSCVVCCARWPRVSRSRKTPQHWRTQPSSVSSGKPTETSLV
jgi:acetyl-CoA synthetase